MGNSRSQFSPTMGTRMFRTKVSNLEETNMGSDFSGEEDGEAFTDRLRENHRRRVEAHKSRHGRRRSVSVDVLSLRRQSSALHENLVKININRTVREVYSGLDRSGNDLGEGSWGTVKLVRRRSSPDRKAAVKILQLTKDIKPARIVELRSEINLLQKIDHPHIAKLFETYEEEGVNLYLVMEYLSGGELFDRVISQGHFRESKAAEAVKQMVGAVQYLHSKGIVHRDLKLENFMYRSKNSDNLVLIDFGLSTRYLEYSEDGGTDPSAVKPATKYLKDMVGSSYYMAPEVMKRKYGQECDMWSIGVIAYMLLSGHPPFAGDTDEQIMRRVRRGTYNFKHAAFKRVTKNAIEFVSLLLKYEPAERMTAKDALVHAWLSEHHERQMRRRSQRRGSVIGGEVVQNLKNFVNTTRFKKLALQAVAYSTDYDDISHLQELFEDIDQDQDGYITIEEFQKALADHPEINQSLTEKIFNAMDVDKTQKIHLNEFIAATMNRSLMQNEKILREAFRKLDINETGEIDGDALSELLGKNLNPKQVQSLFAEFTEDASSSTLDDEEEEENDLESNQKTSRGSKKKKKVKSCKPKKKNKLKLLGKGSGSGNGSGAKKRVSKVTQQQFLNAMRIHNHNKTAELLSLGSQSRRSLGGDTKLTDDDESDAMSEMDEFSIDMDMASVPI